MALVVLLLVVAPLVELYVIIQVAHVIGGWQTIALLVVESMVGAWLLKRQGLSVLARIGDAVDHGRMPGKELVDGLLIIVAGALMLAPGFIGDVVGYLLLLPPTRALVRAPLMKRFAKGGWVGQAFSSSGGGAGARFVGSFRADAYDVTGHEATGRPDDPVGRPPLAP
ncbi:MAG: FxsA family protein [Acidimicrobiales bacterium]|nr:FxsA family protein [Actinomycetota bacterium]